jgi:hypothetical protein
MPKKKGIDGKNLEPSDLEKRHISLPSEALKIVDQISDELGITRSSIIAAAITRPDRFQKLASAADVHLSRGNVPDSTGGEESEPQEEKAGGEKGLLESIIETEDTEDQDTLEPESKTEGEGSTEEEGDFLTDLVNVLNEDII